MMTAKRKWTHSLFALALLALFVSAGTLLADKGGKKKPPKDEPPPPEITISYSIKLLGTLGGDTSSATAMNELGDVAGVSRMADGTGDPFVYFNNTGTMHRLRDLVTPESEAIWFWGSGKGPSGINSFGQICMWLQQSDPHASHAVRISLVFDEETGVVIPGQADIEIVGPHPSSPEDINELGDVLGNWDVGLYTFAFVYSDTAVPNFQEIGHLGSGDSFGLAINNFGQVAGGSRNANDEFRAFRYTPGSGMEELGIIETWDSSTRSDYSHGRGLNDAGVVVGEASAGRSGKRKRRYAGLSYHAFSDAGDGMVDLGTLGGGLTSWARGINAAGDVIGVAHDAEQRRLQFFYTKETGMLELEPLITNMPANTYITARQINNAGEICGTIGLASGFAAAFLLTPNQ